MISFAQLRHAAAPLVASARAAASPASLSQLRSFGRAYALDRFFRDAGARAAQRRGAAAAQAARPRGSLPNNRERALVMGGLACNALGAAVAYRYALPRGLRLLPALLGALPAQMACRLAAGNERVAAISSAPLRRAVQASFWVASHALLGATVVMLGPAYLVLPLSSLVLGSLVGAAIGPLAYLAASATRRDGAANAFCRGIGHVFAKFDDKLAAPAAHYLFWLTMLPPLAPLSPLFAPALLAHQVSLAVADGCLLGARQAPEDAQEVAQRINVRAAVGAALGAATCVLGPIYRPWRPNDRVLA